VRVNVVLFALGAALILVGVALWSLPAALILAGLPCLGLGLLRSEQAKAKARTPKPVRQPRHRRAPFTARGVLQLVPPLRRAS
jgi:hypothetical protein